MRPGQKLRMHGVSRLRRPPGSGKHGQVACGLTATSKVAYTRDRALVTCPQCRADLEAEDLKLALRDGTGTSTPAPVAPPAAAPDVAARVAALVPRLEQLGAHELAGIEDAVRMFEARRGRR
jgi:hypothetical protein